MAVRYRTTFINEKNQTFQVSIHDNDQTVATVTDFKLGADGFTIVHEGQNLERFNSIIPSKCSLSMYIDDAAKEVFIQDVANSGDGRFLVEIELSTMLGYEKFWTGIILPDQVGYTDEYYPFGFRINAIDELSTLNSVDYDDDVTGKVYEDHATILEHFNNVFSHFQGKALYLNSENYYIINSQWYENSQVFDPANKTNPLATARVAHRAFYSIDRDGNIIKKNKRDVLNALLTAFGMRVYQSRGVFIFEQINERFNSAYTTYVYNKTMTLQDTQPRVDERNLGHGQAVELLAQGQYTFLPGLHKVKLNYTHEGARNLLLGGEWNNNSSDNLVIGDVVSDGVNTVLSINANLYFQVNLINTTTDRWRFEFRLKIKHGTKYLKRDITVNSAGNFTEEPMEWVNTLDYYTYSTQWFTANQATNRLISLNFQTPVLPDPEGILEFDFDYYASFKFNESTPFFPPPAPDLAITIWELQEPDMELFLSGEPGELSNTILYQIQNDEHTGNSQTLTENTFIGDAINYTTLGKIEVLDAANEWQQSAEWSIDQAGPNLSIMELLLVEIMRGQKTAVSVLRATVFGIRVYPTTVLLRNNERYLFAGGSYNANRSEYSGEWFALKSDDTNLSLLTPVSGGGSSTTNGGTGSSSGSGGITLRTFIRQDISNASGNSVTVTAPMPQNLRQDLWVFRSGRLLIWKVDFNVSGQDIVLTIEVMDENFSIIIYN